MSEETKHYQTLKRRLEFLERRIEQNNSTPQALNYLMAEASALKWALEITNKYRLAKVDYGTQKH